jgi:hypothetical protein
MVIDTRVISAGYCVTLQNLPKRANRFHSKEHENESSYMLHKHLGKVIPTSINANTTQNKITSKKQYVL